MSDLFRSTVSPIRDFAQEVADERRWIRELFCIIYCSEDGETSLDMIDRETLLKRLTEEYYGKIPVFQLKRGESVNCQNKAGIYIIRGESVVPTPKQIVTEWDV